MGRRGLSVWRKQADFDGEDVTVADGGAVEMVVLQPVTLLFLSRA
jgi:hypothetical protein